MKILLPLLALVATSGAAFAQTEPAPAPAAETAKPVVPTTPLFKDVPPNHWAFAAVQRLASAGIVEGYPSTAAPTTQTVAKVVPPSPVKAATKAPAPAKAMTKAKATPQAKVGVKKVK